MSTICVELHGSRTFSVDVNGGKAKFMYYLSGISDEAAAEAYIRTVAPAQWYNYTMSEIDFTNRPTLNQWFPVVNYTLTYQQLNGGDSPQQKSNPSPADTEAMGGVSMSIALENQKVYRSLSTYSSTGLGGATPPDVKQLIGVSDDGKVEGTEVGVPVTNLTVKRSIGYLTAGYLNTLVDLCGKTNADPYWIFKYAEDGLFIGVNGQEKGSGEFELNYEFKWIKTKTSIVIRSDSGGLTVPTKPGWNYLWTMNRKEKDSVANAMVSRPYAAYVERVYDTADFTLLGL